MPSAAKLQRRAENKQAHAIAQRAQFASVNPAEIAGRIFTSKEEEELPEHMRDGHVLRVFMLMPKRMRRMRSSCGVSDASARVVVSRRFDWIAASIGAVFLESAPFQVLFGVYFWLIIQDRCDRRVRMVGILDRHAYDQRRPSEVIWIRLPSDFGSPDYSRRRAKAITKHLSAIAETTAELLELFDNWLAPSVGLRQYLWAHRHESIETARKLIELIPPVILKTVLGYLVLNYWEHRSGWPDLLVYRANHWFLAEVKSWSDKLNENQNRWIENNHRYLHLPFKLVQVHRMEFMSALPT